MVRLDDRRAGRTKTLAEAKADMERWLLPEKQRAAVQEWLVGHEKTSAIELFPPVE